MARSKKKRGGARMQVFTSCISTSLVLILLGVIVFLVQVAHNLSNSVKEDLVVSVLLSEETDSVNSKQLISEMNQKRFVSRLEYISKEQALKEHIEEMGTDPEEFLGSNPFTASLELHLKADYANTDSLHWITRELRSHPKVLSVVYQKDLVDSLNKNLRRASIILLIIAGLLTFVSFGLINSTVKMSLYSNRFLIHTMKLVGAKWGFIRRPFLKRSFWIGVSSALLANLFLVGGIQLFIHYDPVIYSVITHEMIYIMAGSVFLTGIFITVMCSYISVNKFLKMKASELHEM